MSGAPPPVASAKPAPLRNGAVVIGSGFGARVHVPALRAAGFEVEALVGRDLARTERRARRLKIPRALTSLEEALAIPSVGAVTVATPPAAHAPVVLAALAEKKHVICEKPFALDVTEARAMLDAAHKAGVVHRVGFEFRWAPDRAALARAIDAGAIGHPRFASLVSYVELVADSDVKVPTWWWDTSRGGGWLGASGSHMIDQIRMWLGEIESVSADTASLGEREEVAEDSFALLFRTRSGARGVLQQTGGAWGPRAGMTRIAGTTGSLWTEGETLWHANAAGTREIPIPDDLHCRDVAEIVGDSRQRYTHLELGPYTRLCESFRDAIIASEKTRPASAFSRDAVSGPQGRYNAYEKTHPRARFRGTQSATADSPRQADAGPSRNPARTAHPSRAGRCNALEGSATERSTAAVAAATFEDGLACVKVTEAARLSVVREQWVDIEGADPP